MSKLARVVEGVVVELFTLPEHFEVKDCFVPAIAVQFVPMPADVGVGPKWMFDGKEFTPPHG